MIKINDLYLKKYFKNKRIALVGNSFDRCDLAKEIDKHDIVIRCNLADSRVKKWDYETVKPDVPTGNKITIMAGFWNHMNVVNIVNAYSEIDLLLTVRPETAQRKKYWRETSKMYKVNKKNYFISQQEYKNIASRVGGAPVLVGIVALFILHKYNTAKEINIYNFNFYTPSLNDWNKVQQQVYDKWLHRRHGDTMYGFHEKNRHTAHNLTRSYKWFCKCLKVNKNIQWRLNSRHKDIIKKYMTGEIK